MVFAPVDFERQTLRDGLEATGFDFGAPAIFSWMGVTMYLTLDTIRSTLAAVASCAARTQIALTYNLPRPALETMTLTTEEAQALRRIVTEMGEPMISLFTPAEIEQVLRDVGFDEVAHIGPGEACDMYFADRPDVRFLAAQRLVIAKVANVAWAWAPSDLDDTAPSERKANRAASDPDTAVPSPSGSRRSACQISDRPVLSKRHDARSGSARRPPTSLVCEHSRQRRRRWRRECCSRSRGSEARDEPDLAVEKDELG